MTHPMDVEKVQQFGFDVPCIKKRTKVPRPPSRIKSTAAGMLRGMRCAMLASDGGKALAQVAQVVKYEPRAAATVQRILQLLA